MNWWLHLKLVG